MSKKFTMISGWIIVLGLFFAMPGFASGAGKQEQQKCPILGRKIDKQVFTDYQGYRVYFCCVGCISKFEEDADKHIAKMKAAGIELEKTPPQDPGQSVHQHGEDQAPAAQDQKKSAHPHGEDNALPQQAQKKSTHPHGGTGSSGGCCGGCQHKSDE